jgi:endonuclease/exonuclease/phosphatase family metal-dependent hydrolase
MKLRLATYNIHKGFSHFNRRMMVHELRHHLRLLDVDLVFLQEVQGEHALHARHVLGWPAEPQYEFLAEEVWPDFAYGRNAVYDHGHHGNAILSRFPIVSAENQNVSTNRFEQRGLLHCEVALGAASLHCMCVHFGLYERGRRRQLSALTERVRRLVPAGAPLIVAGDFNDWRNSAGRTLVRALDLQEVFRDQRGRPARTYPSTFPLLRLDRIYARGFEVRQSEVHRGLPWSRISDHAALSVELELR